MDDARRFVEIKRRRKQIKEEDDALKLEEAELSDLLLEHIANGDLPHRGSFDGATVSPRTEIRASAVDHDQLAAALRIEGRTDLLPRTINSNSLSGYVREQIKEWCKEQGISPEQARTIDLEERLSHIDPDLRRLMNVTEEIKMQATGL